MIYNLIFAFLIISFLYFINKSSNNVNNRNNRFLFERIPKYFNYISQTIYILFTFSIFIYTLGILSRSDTKKIDIYAEKKSTIYKKYSKNMNLKSNELNSTENLVAEFYNYRVLNQDSNKFIELLTSDYYNKSYNARSTEILQKQWKLTNKYNNKELSDFIGYESSIPQISDDKKSYNIFVVEYWENDTLYLKYDLKYENNKYKIDNISIDNQSFLLNN